MGGPHERPLIGWHSHDATLKPWLDGEAARRQVDKTQILDEALVEYRLIRTWHSPALDRAWYDLAEAIWCYLDAVELDLAIPAADMVHRGIQALNDAILLFEADARASMEQMQQGEGFPGTDLTSKESKDERGRDPGKFPGECCHPGWRPAPVPGRAGQHR
jgi:hypothetical protein